jgi:predicted phosphoribosyltransferase/pimeloyl-ACP methyl ester carboxylesterase
MFRNRVEAGRRLARALASFASEDPVVLGLPRGGVPVAAEVARALGAPLDVAVVRKLGLPRQPELAMGAIGEEGTRVLNDEVVEQSGVTADVIDAVEQAERQVLEHRVAIFRHDREPVTLQARTAVIVDDGIATGATARAACQIARARGARRIVLAVPVGSRDRLEQLRDVADDVICLEIPDAFFAVGQAYADFRQVSDQEVVEVLNAATPAEASVAGSTELTVVLGDARLEGRLTIPERATGLVVFAHGSGSSRLSPRNEYVAQVLNGGGFATFLFDLLTEAEARDRSNVFDIELLGTRLAETAAWLRTHRGLSGLPLGLFGASTGAAAALAASLVGILDVSAVVSRGGRPDLLGERLREVSAPTLLIVGGDDTQVIELNRWALDRMPGADLAVVPGATHLFEEPGTLSEAAGLARDWFQKFLG